MTICHVCHQLDNDAAMGQYVDDGDIVQAHLSCAQQVGLVGVDEVEEGE